MPINLLYFASLREKVGLSEEIVEVPEEVRSIAELIAWLRLRGPQYNAAFAETEIVRAAIDQEHASADAPIHNAREIAFFPPVTGG